MARKQKLKVYRTPIGFHDAYVAAPSQKEALEAWGADANLFSRGVAETVTDAELVKEPLGNPGKVIRRLRGSAEEHLAALPADVEPSRKRRSATQPRSTAKPSSTSKSAKRPRKQKPRPSRSALEQAELKLDHLLKAQEWENHQLKQREQAIVKERRSMERNHSRALATATTAVEKARKAHSRAISRWLADEA